MSFRITSASVSTPAFSVKYSEIVISAVSYMDIAMYPGFIESVVVIPPVDSVVPTLSITSGSSSIYQGASTTVNFTFSEDVGTTFIQSDAVVSGGTLSNFTGSGTNYSVTFTGTSVGTASISVPSGAYADAAGNLGTASSLNISVIPALEVFPFFSVGSTQPYSALSSLMSMGSDPVTMEYKTIPFAIRFGEN